MCSDIHGLRLEFIRSYLSSPRYIKNPERDILIYPLSVSNPWSESIGGLGCGKGGEQKKPAYCFENRQTSLLYEIVIVRHGRSFDAVAFPVPGNTVPRHL